MAEKRVTKVFTVLILLVIAALAGMVIKVKMDQKNSVEESKERYRQMISGEQIMTLTDDILEEDFDQYVQDTNRARNLLHIFVGCNGAFLGLIVLWMLIKAVFDVINRKGIGNFIVHIIVAVIFAGAFVGGYILLKDKIFPEIESEDPASAAHYFEEMRLVGVQKDVRAESANPQDDESSKTEVYYYLLTDTGSRIRVKEEIFERFGEPGVYYAGRTEDTVFSLYEGKYFKLFGK